jgi:hypothetical protein
LRKIDCSFLQSTQLINILKEVFVGLFHTCIMEAYDYDWCDDERGPMNFRHTRIETKYDEYVPIGQLAKEILQALEEDKWNMSWDEVEWRSSWFEPIIDSYSDEGYGYDSDVEEVSQVEQTQNDGGHGNETVTVSKFADT